MSWYPLLKQVHVACALLSLCGFILRGWWMWRGSPLLSHRLTRILPHLVDTLLLASAVGLLFMIGQYPFVQGWLTAKVLALLLYILFGTLALKRGKTHALRLFSLAMALLTFAYIAGVALSHDPRAFLVF